MYGTKKLLGKHLLSSLKKNSILEESETPLVKKNILENIPRMTVEFSLLPNPFQEKPS